MNMSEFGLFIELIQKVPTIGIEGPFIGMFMPNSHSSCLVCYSKNIEQDLILLNREVIQLIDNP